MKIFITGDTGFIGEHFKAYFSSLQDEVVPVSLRDKFDIAPFEGDAIIHLAGKAHDTKNTSAESEYFHINTELTKKVFDQYLKSNIRDFIFFSSVKATADAIDGVLDENHPSSPQTPYGKSKWEAEKYLLSKNLTSGKRLFIIRPCMIHGPGNKGNLNLLYKVVEKGIPWPLASFENRRSFLSIDNLNYLVYKIINSDIPSGIYNFADDKTISTNELVRIIAKTSGKREKLWHISAGLISGVAKLGDIIKLPLNSERLKKLTESYVVSNQKIKTALNIDSLPISAEEGMKKTIESFILDKK